MSYVEIGSNTHIVQAEAAGIELASSSVMKLNGSCNLQMAVGFFLKEILLFLNASLI